MKRRSFLAMLGLAPVAAATSTMAKTEKSYFRVQVGKLDPATVIEFKDGKVTFTTARIISPSGNMGIDLDRGSIEFA